MELTLLLLRDIFLFNLLNKRNIVESDSNVILLSPGLFPEIVEEIKEKCGKHGIQVSFCGSKDNIWVRDYMPIQLGENNFIEYQYTPDYLLSSKCYNKYLVTSEHYVVHANCFISAICMLNGRKVTAKIL